MGNNPEALRIDVEKVIAGKSEKLLKRLPRFLIRYLKKIIHQDDINQFLEQNQGLEGIDFVRSALNYFDVSLEIIGAENIPAQSNIIVVSNHPLGGFDGLCLIQLMHDQFGKGKTLTNDLLMNLTPLHPVFLGVDTVSSKSKSRDSVENIDKTFKGDEPIVVFPAGLVSRRKKGIIKDPPWKKTFVSRATKYKRDVLPIYFEGRVSNFFYNLSNFRKFLGIKTNIELLYLSNETFKQKQKKLKLYIGKPIPYSTFNSEHSPREWALKVQDLVYTLNKKTE